MCVPGTAHTLQIRLSPHPEAGSRLAHRHVHTACACRPPPRGGYPRRLCARKPGLARSLCVPLVPQAETLAPGGGGGGSDCSAGVGVAGSLESRPWERHVALCTLAYVYVCVLCAYIRVCVFVHVCACGRVCVYRIMCVPVCDSACEQQAAALAGPPWKC